ncbi:hypothetical protein [Microlunatus sp. Y2014]|uniref:hypothetical protein n=1 Tax=Microlunatus sp. Y2014 TaxID=3418488 RepID=UPI003DA74A1E
MTTRPLRTTRRSLLAFTAAGLAVGGLAQPVRRAHAAPPSLDLNAWIEEQVDYIVGKQVASGALRGPTDDQLQPYFSNWAAQGLAAANTPRSREALGKYIGWMLNHVNTAEEDPYGIPGTISDWHYDEETGEETSEEEYSSTDAGTTVPMIAAYDAFQTGDRDLQHLVMENLDTYWVMASATTDGQYGVRMPDHLCWARPNVKMKYVQDNGVVYKGLSKLAWLMRRAGRGQQGRFLALKARQTRRAMIDILWDEERKNWGWGHGETLFKDSEPWDRFMADAWCQYWQVQLDVTKPNDRMSKLAWQAYTAPDAYPRWMYNEIDNNFPHTEMAYSAVLMGEPENAVRLLQLCKEQFSDNNWGSLPWYHGEAGHTLRTARLLLDTGYGK